MIKNVARFVYDPIHSILSVNIKGALHRNLGLIFAPGHAFLWACVEPPRRYASAGSRPARYFPKESAPTLQSTMF